MNANKIKIAFVTILGLVLVIGIYLLIRTPNPNDSKSGGSGRGFLSFFGERRTKPLDDTVVPGASTAGSTAGATGGTSGDTAGATGGQGSSASGTGSTGGAITGGQGSFSVRSIGSNGISGGFATGGGTSGSGSAGSGSGGSSSGGSGSGGTGGGPNPIPQIDCTPPQLPYTEQEIAQLKDLTNQFYRISANLHTDVDIQNELDTRKSYFDLYNQTISYTKQCYDQVKVEMAKTDPTKRKAIDSNARWHPYLTEAVLNKIAAYPDPRISFTRPLTNKDQLQRKITELNSSIASADAQIAYLNNLSSRNLGQNTRLADLQVERANYINDRAIYQTELDGIAKPTVISSAKDVLGSFFPQDVFDGVDLKQSRKNLNFRREYLWRGVEGWIQSNDKDVYEYFFWNSDKFCKGKDACAESGWQYNPLVELLWDPRHKETWLDTAGFGQAWVNPFREIEDGLRVW